MTPADPTVLDFLRAGCALTPIPCGHKGPTAKGWQRRENALAGIKSAPRFAGRNAGLLHVSSGTCALDVDDVDGASEFLAARGIDLEALFMRDDVVTVSSGVPNRGKLLFRLPPGAAPLRTLRLAGGALELRCASADGESMQDVISGTHPSGSAYSVRGDVANMPTLPDQLLILWQGLLVNGSADAGPREPQAHGEAILTGARDNTLTSLAGTMRRRGMSPEAIMAALLAECGPLLAAAARRGRAAHCPLGR